MKKLFFLFVSLFPMFTFAISEVERIQSHLQLVESLLRLKDTTDLGENEKNNRQAGLDALHQYWKAGQFPENSLLNSSRRPIFVDDSGVHCAVAYLIAQSGRSDLVTRLSHQYNFNYLEQMSDQELNEWVQLSGFASEELRLIQPAYGFEPRIQPAYGFEPPAQPAPPAKPKSWYTTQTERLSDFITSFIPIEIEIVSNPSLAKIILNGIDTGKMTPDKIEIPGRNDHRLMLIKQGYVDISTDISAKNKKRRYYFNLVPLLEPAVPSSTEMQFMYPWAPLIKTAGN